MHRLSHCWIRSFSSSAQQVSTPARNGSVETIRTFVAIFPERSVSASIAKFTKRLHPHLERSNVRWTSLDNLHFTLCFLGNLESWQLARVEDIVEKTGRLFNAFELQIGSIGVFPSWDKPRTLYLKAIQGHNELKRIAKHLQSAFEAARIVVDESRGSVNIGRRNALMPHLTIGRWSDVYVTNLKRLGLVDTLLAEGEAFRMSHKVKSDLKSTGPLYTILNRIMLR